MAIPIPTAYLATGATGLAWGGLLFTNVLTRTFVQQIVMDPSNTVMAYSKFILVIEAHVHPEADGCFGVYAFDNIYGFGSGELPAYDFNNASLQAKRQYMASHLAVQRLQFAYFVDQVPVLSGSHDPGAWSTYGIDVDNGPKIRDVQIVDVAGGKAFKVYATFEVCRVACAPSDSLSSLGQPYPPSENILNDPNALKQIMYVRWSTVESRDEDFTMTRITQGRLRIMHWTFWQRYESALRGMVMPPLLNGYQRKKITAVFAENQLDMMYMVVDKQREAAPPFPAIDWSGSVMEHVNKEGGGGQMQVTMVGAPGTPKKYLFWAAWATIDAKLDLEKIQTLGRDGQATGVLMTDVQMMDVIQSNIISVTVSYRRSKIAEKWVEGFRDMLDVLPSVSALIGEKFADLKRTEADKYNRDQWPIPYPRDESTPMGYAMMQLTQPCFDTYPRQQYQSPPGPPDYTAENDDDDSGTEISAYKGQLDTVPEPDYAQSTKNAQPKSSPPYLWAEIEGKYYNETGVCAMPVARVDYDGRAGLPFKTGRLVDYSAVFYRVHGDMPMWTMYYKAERAGAVPQLPTYKRVFTDINGIVYAMIESEVFPKAPTTAADGVELIHHVEARYTYVMSRYFKNNESMTAGELPWLALDQQTHLYKLTDDTQRDMKLFGPDSENTGSPEPSPPDPQDPREPGEEE